MARARSHAGDPLVSSPPVRSRRFRWAPAAPTDGDHRQVCTPQGGRGAERQGGDDEHGQEGGVHGGGHLGYSGIWSSLAISLATFSTQRAVSAPMVANATSLGVARFPSPAACRSATR